METKNLKKVSANELIKEVENAVISLTARGGLDLPKDYSAANALRAAALILQETVDKDKKPVLESCSKISIINSLLKMIVLGLNPLKKQCYFVAYGGKLTLMVSYQGKILLAKRAGLKNINAQVVYKGDIFEYSIDDFGLVKISKHEQKLTNIENEIIAAYCVFELENGFKNTVIMTMNQIKKAWLQGTAYKADGNSAHQKFTDEMAKKTVISRALKTIINSSDDFANLIEDNEEEQEQAETKDIDYTTIIDLEEAESENEISENKAEAIEHKEEKKVEQKVEQPKTIENGKIPF